jgi:hypothetical protein
MGVNGGGKTTLAKALLDSPLYPRVVILDPKGDFTLSSPHTILHSPRDWRWDGFFHHQWRPDKIIYRPDVGWDNKDAYEYILYRLFERARQEGRKNPFIIYIDEMLYLAKLGAVKRVSTLAVSGRSLNVGLWISSQRPKWIPIELRSEAWRWYIFPLGYEEDEKEVVAYTKGQITMQDLRNFPHDFGFWETKRNKSGGKIVATYFPPLKLDKV